MRIIQKGSGPTRNVLVAFYCQAAIAAMAAAVPDALVISVDTTKQPLTRQRIRDLAKSAGAEELGEVALAGWSAGCHGVRDNLDAVTPEVVIALDGTHGSIPQPGSMPLEPWKRFAAAALKERVLFVASHTYLLYVEKLKAPHGPYLATATVLRQLTGEALPEPEGRDPAVFRKGDFVVYSYASGDADQAAHIRQIREVGPMLVADWLAPRWNPEKAKPTSGETAAGLLESAILTAEEDIEDATEDLVVISEPGAALALVGPGHGYRAAVHELVADARALQTLHRPGDGYAPKVGDLIVSPRLGENPLQMGRGHVERITAIEATGEPPRFEGALVRTIGGNENNRWTEAPFAWPGQAVAVIEVPLEVGALAIEVAHEEQEAGVVERPGDQHHPSIQAYHAGARRGGSPLAGMPGHETEGGTTLGKAPDETEWCATGASWCAREAMRRLAG